MKIGIIYKITNLVNGKIYIGKTKEYYGKTKFGIDGRFKTHKWAAMAGKKGGCRLLNNAIRKHGVENFKIEKLLNCELEEINDLETKTIAEYDSTNHDIGYNIALGGKGRSVVHVDEIARENISNALRKDKLENIDNLDDNSENNELNIQAVNRGGMLVVYKVRRREHGAYNKWFTSTEYTPEQNFEKAKEWLEDFKDGNIRLDTKNTGLPENINYATDKKSEIVGYQVAVMKDGIKFYRGFINSEQSMEYKLEQAIAYKESILNGKPLEKDNTNLKHNDLPRNVNIYKNKSGKIVGYVGKVIVNKKIQKKVTKLKILSESPRTLRP